MPRATLRLFVAIYPPPLVARRLRECLDPDSLPAYRPVPPDQVHLTLQFIGDRPARELDTVIESVQRAASGLSSFELLVQRIISLPERGASRLLAASTDCPPTLLELKERLVTRLATRTAHRRAFTPHMTLLRYRQPSRAGRLDQPLACGPLPFPVDDVRVMRSTLSPDGAVHEELTRVALSPQG
ncbi:MAG: RNA 2',3'-cyclic phosphodiesterase [Planctomycetota bacterium]|jgi:2'-5' RNA ligase